MFGRILLRFLAGLVLLAAIAGIAYFVFNAGVAQGVALDAAKAGDLPNPGYYGMPYGRHFFGFGPFGLLGCLIPLFLLFLAFASFRHLLWGGPRWAMRHHGPWGRHSWGEGVPPMFDEWHRRAHGGSSGEEQPPAEKTL